VRAYVGVTDTAWYRFLASRPELTDVNFWLPGGGGFGSLGIGEPFVFKSKYPENRLVGAGFFNGAITLPISDAWRIFQAGNGVPTLHDLRTAIARYRRVPLDRLGDPEIGCVMLSETFFLDESAHVAAPVDWGKSIVRGKTYHGEVAASLAESVLAGLLADHGSTTSDAGPVFGAPHLTATRLGQRPFQALVLNAYERRCAVTGDKIRPVLQAAHILPVAHGGENRLDNGLLLRSDVHTLFDNGYVAVDDHYRLRVSPRLRSEFGNGEEFYRLEKTVIGLPHRRADRPSQNFLEWHRDTVFLSA
jgi:putative restriction endonuclease